MQDYMEEKERRMNVRKTRKFKSTNSIWNELGLNRSWSIGYLTKLFKEYGGKDYMEWVIFYENSGNQRLRKIMELPLQKQQLLMDFSIHRNDNASKLHTLSLEEKNLNAFHGRTKKELNEIAWHMYNAIRSQGNPLSITKAECRDFVEIRVVDEIFIGVEREMNTLATLKKEFPTLNFKEIDVKKDAKFAVDFEVYQDDKLLLALQVKSSHYKQDNQSVLLETKVFNNEKHKNYEKSFGVNVAYVYADVNGTIEDDSLLHQIRELAS